MGRSINTDVDNLYGLDTTVRKVNNILNEAAIKGVPKTKKHRKDRKRTSRLKVWTPDIQKAVEEKKRAFYELKQAGRPKNGTDQMVLNKKLTTIALRQAIRFKYNNKQVQIRQEILEARTHNSKLFHKLINKQRRKLVNCVNELNVGDKTFRAEGEILS